MDPETTMGPLTVPSGVDKVASQVANAQKLGAKVVMGGSRVESLGGGYFFEPTIIKDAVPEMLTTTEETFGPLLALYPFDTEDEAVQAANNTSVSGTKLSYNGMTIYGMTWC